MAFYSGVVAVVKVCRNRPKVQFLFMAPLWGIALIHYMTHLMITLATYREDKNPATCTTFSYLSRNFSLNLMVSPFVTFLLNLHVLYSTLSMSSTDILGEGTVLPRKRLCSRCGVSGKNWIKKIPPSEVWREGVGSGGRGATLVTCGTPHRSPLSSPCCR